MKRAAALYGVILVVLTGLSWLEWTSEPEVDRGDKVELLAGKSSEITEVRWKGEKSEATLERKQDARGPYVWASTVRWTKKPVPRTSGEDGAPVELGEPEMIAKTSVFKASAKADQLLDDLSPMLALRRLDVTDPDKLEEIGLGSPSATLDIVRDGQTQSLEIGGEAYGSRHIYVRRVADGQIYLVERELLQGLKYARSRLADHGLIGMPVKTIAKARITAGGATLAAVQKNADDSKAAVWALESDEESRPEQLTTWMGQALKLKGMRYADPEDGPADLKARFSLVLTDAKGDSDTLEVLQVGEGGDWYGRSGHTRGLVKLVRSAARSLADDVESVIEAGD